jgi:hypothetical protein
MKKTMLKTISKGVAQWCSYYRANPHRFAKDYLHLNLHLFQKILIVMMNWSTTTAFRGMTMFIWLTCPTIGQVLVWL